MEFYQYIFEAMNMKMIIVVSAVMVQWFGVIACLKWIWKNWILIVVIVTWNVIASLGWIWKSRFSYMVETPEPISEDNQEPVDVDVSASLPSSSAELTAPTWKHDVFLSFRGVDTRKNITFFLYNRLRERGIKTFKDEQDIEVGDVISPTLLTAIEESRLAIIVLSQNYASSSWCLEELGHICKSMKGDESDDNRILPLFYNVNPSDVRHQTSRFGDAFTKLKKSGRHESAKVEQWIDTLTKVAQISGWHSMEFKNDGELLNNIVEAVCKKLPPTESVLKMSLGDFEEFAATKEAIHEVMKALKDGEATTIGVYGMGGVGKTTMVKHVGVQAQEEKLFNKVIMAVVSQKPDFKEIQQEFAETLGFELKKKTESVRARELKKKIMEETRILIILDDIWKGIDFSRIGIPSHNELQKCNSKVLLTTRRLKVCSIMGSHAKIPLKILSEADSWRLFVREAGMSSDKSPNFYDVASEVARECAGLPVALIAVARALRDEGLDRWKEAARRLKSSQPPIREDEKAVFKCIKLSYDFLKDDELKSCFLLCCLFPEDYDIPIEYLVMYGIGKGMFRDLTMLQARESTYSVVQDLEDSSLLLGGRDDGCVRMHDVIRDMAILMTSLSEDGQRFLVKVGCELTNWPEIDAHKGYSAISLMKNKICKLPEELVCPNLQILSLRQNASLNDIPKSFFPSQNELRVLDLSNTRISLLPQSIVFLTNLQALYLDYCRNLMDTSVIGKLNKLEILSMRGTALKKLSREIEQLTNLRMLDISAAALSLGGSICTIPSKVISKLHKLEELYMQYGFWDWGSKIDGEGEETNIGFDELAGLSNLSILKVCILDANCIPKSVEVEPNWVYFDISICSGKSGQGIYNILRSGNNYRSLSLDSTDTTMGTFPDWFVNAVVKNTERLRYEECKCLSNILVEYDRGRLHGLKVLSVKGRCENLKELMNAKTCVPDMPVFENLEELYLEELDDLKQLCVGELPPGSLCSLKLLKVHQCRNLEKVLLPSNLLQKLPNLEILNCEESKVDHVFECKGFEPDQTKLREMELRDLDLIRSICNGPAPRRMFQALKQLVIHNCNFQGSLFTFDVAQCLFQLESLVVSECPVLERVIEAKRKTLNNNKTVLPQLKNLCLQYLPMLYKGSATVDFVCPSLETLHLRDCPHLSFPPSSASDYFHSRNPVNEDWSLFLRFKVKASVFRRRNMKKQNLSERARPRSRGREHVKKANLSDRARPL